MSSTPTTYSLRLTPRAESQLESFSPLVAGAVKARLNRLVTRRDAPMLPERADTVAPCAVQGHLISRTFRALYEVDHEEGTVTVLDVAPRIV